MNSEPACNKSEVISDSKIIESSRIFPRIIENKKCNIKISVLSTNTDSTTDSSFNIRNSDKAVGLSNINMTTTKSFTSLNTESDCNLVVFCNDTLSAANNDKLCYNNPQTINISQISLKIQVCMYNFPLLI